MKGDRVQPDEQIAKAICLDKYDPATGEISPSLFKGSGSSVSRLAICDLTDTWVLFRSRVERPPDRTLERIGTIQVGDLEKIGREFRDNPTDLTVIEVPLEEYPSHAEIPEKISRGLSNVLVRNLQVHQE